MTDGTWDWRFDFDGCGCKPHKPKTLKCWCEKDHHKCDKRLKCWCEEVDDKWEPHKDKKFKCECFEIKDDWWDKRDRFICHCKPVFPKPSCPDWDEDWIN